MGIYIVRCFHSTLLSYVPLYTCQMLIILISMSSLTAFNSVWGIKLAHSNNIPVRFETQTQVRPCKAQWFLKGIKIIHFQNQLTIHGILFSLSTVDSESPVRLYQQNVIQFDAISKYHNAEFNLHSGNKQFWFTNRTTAIHWWGQFKDHTKITSQL